MADCNSQTTSGKESFLFKYLLSSTAAAVAETGVDFDVRKWNKKEVDNYVSTMLLEIEKGEKELAEKEKWLKELDAPKCLQTGQEEISESSTSVLRLDEEMGKENDDDDCIQFKKYDNQQKWNLGRIDSESERGLGIDGKEYEEKKKRLAEIRKADYNDYLKQKDSLELEMKKANRQLFLLNQIASHNQTLGEEFANEHLGKSKSYHFNSSEKSLYQISSDTLVDQHNRPPSSLNKNEYKNHTSRGVNCQQSVCSIKTSVSPHLQKSDVRRGIAALYKEQLDKQIAEKQKMQSLHREYTELCDKKNEIRAMQQVMRMQEEYVEELKKHDKIKAAFKLQEERCKKLEEFVKKDRELKKPKFHKSDEYSQLLVHDLDNMSISNVLADLSDIRQKAIKTQRMLDHEINHRQRKNH